MKGKKELERKKGRNMSTDTASQHLFCPGTVLN